MGSLLKSADKVKMWTRHMYYGYSQNVSKFEQTPTSSQFIEALADIEVKSSSQIEEKECSICLKVPEVGDILHQLPCKHSFHKSCIIQWLKKINSCPLCRTEFPSQPQSQIVRTPPNAESEVRVIQENQERGGQNEAAYAYGYPQRWNSTRPQGQNLTAYANPPRPSLRGQNSSYAYLPQQWNFNGIFL